MPVQKINTYNHPALKMKARLVDFNADKALLDGYMADLIDTMNEHRKICVGLALNQIWPYEDQPLAMFIAKISYDHVMVFINPTIHGTGNKISEWEGCMSYPGKRVMVKRDKNVTVTFQDLAGESHEIKIGHPYSRIIQHEMDHLKGKSI